MTIVRTICEMREAGTKGASLVPTLGALHEGHLSLIGAAKAIDRPVVLSVFVNPTQFGPNEDYLRYPRDIDRDARLAESAGADLLFNPEVEEMYRGASTTILVPKVTDRYEGRIRPGHFNGVATVVCKLFQIVQPEVAFFGLKDLQQCAVISRMVADLDIPVELRFEPTVREKDGLAMSSRNVYLSPENRVKAPEIYRLLSDTRHRLVAGDEPKEVLTQAVNRLTESGFLVDYYDLIDTTTFEPTSQIGPTSALIVAAKLGNTRLIDNLLLFDGPNMS